MVESNDRIERLFAQYQEHRDNAAAVQQKMRAIAATATSPRREVTVTVGQGGVLTDIQFANGAYRRMSPADLSAAVLATFAEAKGAAFKQAAVLLAPMLPEGLDAEALVNGTAGMDALLPAEPRMPTSVREILTRRGPAS